VGDLDFSELSDDQLVGLVRAALQECVRRNPAVTAAVKAAVLDEAEKAKIAIEAGNREAARLRALERERVAKEAAEAVKKQAEAQAAIGREARIAREVAEATAKAAEEAGYEADVLARAAAILGRNTISVIVTPNDPAYGAGTRVLINPGRARYEREHLVDYVGAPTNRIKTAREFTGKKAELIPFCAELAARWKNYSAGVDDE
jgi:hypothetical protein